MWHAVFLLLRAGRCCCCCRRERRTGSHKHLTQQTWLCFKTSKKNLNSPRGPVPVLQHARISWVCETACVCTLWTQMCASAISLHQNTSKAATSVAVQWGADATVSGTTSNGKPSRCRKDAVGSVRCNSFIGDLQDEQCCTSQYWHNTKNYQVQKCSQLEAARFWLW